MNTSYPEGQERYDLLREGADVERARERIGQVGPPKAYPVFGPRAAV
jgi:uncharacterized protein YjlB